MVERLVEYIRSIEGPVFLPQHAMLGWQAGKETYQVHDTTFFDLTSVWPSDSVDQQMVDALAAQRWEVIILSNSKWFPQYLSRSYVQIDPPFKVSPRSITHTGAPMIPRYVYVRRGSFRDPSTLKATP